MKALRNVMPVNLHWSHETCSVEARMLTSLTNPGDDCNAEKVPEFMGCVVESLEMVELDSRKPRPPGLSEDLLLELVLSSPFFVEAIKKAWFIYAKRNGGMLAEHIQKLKENVGISPIYESDYTMWWNGGAKYKPIVKKVIPVSTQDLEGVIPVYQDIHIGKLRPLPIVPTKMED